MSGFGELRFPGYTLRSRIGSGGLSTVYLACQDALSRDVAFKVMSAAMARQEGFGARFLREAHIVASLNHRNIVQVHDTGEVDGNYFLAMEYLPRGDLTQLTGKPIPPREALRITSSVLEALEFAASRGVVHRDVKPANIMFREDGAVVLVDFGIAFRNAPDERVTQVGTIIGTPRYMSPEQFDGRDVDGRSDIYSVGVVLFELLMGHPPFDGDSAMKIGIRHGSAPVPRLSSDLVQFQGIIDTALAKRPEERYQSAGTFLDTLAGLSGAAYAGVTVRTDTDVNRAPLDSVTQDPFATGAPLRGLAAEGSIVARPPPREVKSRGMMGSRPAVLTFAALRSPPFLAAAALAGICVVAATLYLLLGSKDEKKEESADAQQTVIAAEVDWSQRAARERDQVLALVQALQPLGGAFSEEALRVRFEQVIQNADGLGPAAQQGKLSELRAELNRQLATAERRFTAGSTPRQIESALRVCKAVDPECERAWYESEVLREVTLQPFRLQRREVTVAEFREFVRDTRHVTVAEKRGYSYAYFQDGVLQVGGLSWRQPFVGDERPRDDWPVMHMASTDAIAYCRWRGGRLPQAEEWEYVARGPERRIYTWGDSWNAALAPIEADQPRPVGSLDQDAFFAGATELTGNVWEWVTLRDGGYGLKGGSYREFNPANMRAAVRREEMADVTLSDDGIRCAFDSDEWPETRQVDTGRAVTAQEQLASAG